MPSRAITATDPLYCLPSLARRFVENRLELAHQLSTKKKLRRGQTDPNKEFEKACRDIRRIEVFWNDATHSVYFTVPKEHESFTETNKAHFLAQVDIENAESRAKSLIDESEDMWEEVQ
jgi:hypothetical protein